MARKQNKFFSDLCFREGLYQTILAKRFNLGETQEVDQTENDFSLEEDESTANH